MRQLLHLGQLQGFRTPVLQLLKLNQTQCHSFGQSMATRLSLSPGPARVRRSVTLGGKLR